MFDELHYFEGRRESVIVSLPFRLEKFVQSWTELRQRMAKSRPDNFGREEWGYIIRFLEKDNLMRPFLETWGSPIPSPRHRVNSLFRPRGPVSIWLPNNVSLLGPLSVILMSLTGNNLKLKIGSRSEDLTTAFLTFCRHSLKDGVLLGYLRKQVEVVSADHDDLRQARTAREAKVRIVFGSDEAATAIEALPHSLDSIGFSFPNRQSEAWIEPRAITAQILTDLIKVFAVYGQAGCTAPHRVILLNGTWKQAIALRSALLERWPKIITGRIPVHLASENVMTSQWGRALGWDAELSLGNGSVVAVGRYSLEPLKSRMALPIIPASFEAAQKHLPKNIQTLGHAVKEPRHPRWFKALAATSVKRFVLLSRMHHFGPVWDGWSFWREAFEEVVVDSAG